MFCSCVVKFYKQVPLTALLPGLPACVGKKNESFLVMLPSEPEAIYLSTAFEAYYTGGGFTTTQLLQDFDCQSSSRASYKQLAIVHTPEAHTQSITI